MKASKIMTRLALGRLVAAITLSCALPVAAKACDASGPWALVQSNGSTVSLELNQAGPEITGTAYEGAIGMGRVSGSVQGTRVFFDIYWPNGTIGAYSGRIGADGLVHHGFTYDKQHQESRATWYSTRPMSCEGGE
jgi:hypothetical protein